MMNKKEIVKRLEGNSVEITSAELRALLPLSYDYMREMLESFVEDESNQTTQKDLIDYDVGIYPVQLSFQDRKIRYYAGYDVHNQPAWFEDGCDDINVDVLEEILYLILCTKIEKILKEEDKIEDYIVDIDKVPLVDGQTGEVLVEYAISVWIMLKEDSEDTFSQSILHLFPGYLNSLVYYTKAGLSEKAAQEINNIIGVIS